MSNINIGFLGITLNKYSSTTFYSIKKANIGILTIDGEFEENSQKINQFIFTTSNNVLKVNKEVVLFINEFNLNQLCNNFKYLDGNSIGEHSNNTNTNALLSLGSKIFAFDETNEDNHLQRNESAKTQSLHKHAQDYNKGIKEILVKLFKANKRKNFKQFNTKIDNRDKSHRLTSIFPSEKESKRGLHLDSIEEDPTKVERNSTNLPVSFVRQNKAMKNHSIKIVHDIINISASDLETNESYVRLERKKIVELFKIWNSFLILHKNKQNILTNDDHLQNNNESNEKSEIISHYFNFDILKVNDTFIQSIILNVLLLHLLSIFHKDLTFHILKLILKDLLMSNKEDSKQMDRISFHLRNILDTELPYLLGFYFELYDEYVVMSSLKSMEMKEKQMVQNNHSNNRQLESIKKLEMSKLILNVNALINNHKEYSKFYLSDFHFDLRKTHINNFLIKNIDKDLDIFDTVLNLTQEIYDYIIMRKFNHELIKSCTFHFKIFLEIRINFFEHINKLSPDSNKLYSTLSDRKFNEYRSKNLSNSLYFMSNPNTKINGLNHKTLSNNEKREFSPENKLRILGNLNNLLNEKASIKLIKKGKLASTLKPQIFLKKSDKTASLENFKLDVINQNTESSQTSPYLKTEPIFPTELIPSKHPNSNSNTSTFKLDINSTSSSINALYRKQSKNTTKANSFKNSIYNTYNSDKEKDSSLILYQNAFDKKNNKLKRNNVMRLTTNIPSLKSFGKTQVITEEDSDIFHKRNISQKTTQTNIRSNLRFNSTSTSPMRKIFGN